MPAPQQGQTKVGVGSCAFASPDKALSNSTVGILTFNNCRALPKFFLRHYDNAQCPTSL